MDNDALSRSEFLLHIEQVRADLHEIRDHLTGLNDRTRTSERAIAVLEDRGHPAAWGGGIGGAVVGFVEAVRWLIGKP